MMLKRRQCSPREHSETANSVFSFPADAEAFISVSHPSAGFRGLELFYVIHHAE